MTALSGDPSLPQEERSHFILIVDDDEGICEVLSTYLRPRGYRILSVHTGAGALDLLAKETPDVVILDLRLPDMEGQGILREIRERFPETEVVIITGFATLDSALSAIKAGAFDYIVKPFKLGEIDIAVRNALDRIRLREQNRILAEKVRELSMCLERLSSRPAYPTIRFEERSTPAPFPEPRGNPFGVYRKMPERKP